MTIIEVEGAWNVRDVGGIPAAGGRIRTGVLFRSGNLSGVTDRGARVLHERVRQIVDLRAEPETTSQPTAVSDIPITNLPLFHGSVMSFLERDATLEELYLHILDQGAVPLVEVIRILGTGVPALVHCTVGKDRTGMAVALALAAVGAERGGVIADYALTESQLPEELTGPTLAYLRSRHPGAKNLETLATRSPAPVMHAILEHLDRKFGGPAEYLRAHGLTDGELSDLQANLVEAE